VRDLDDPENPYREQYGAWDRWLLANAKNPTMEEMQAWRDGKAPEGYIYLRPSATEEGWLVPQLVELETLLRQQTELTAYKNRPHCVLTFSAAGVADPAMLKELEAAKLKLWASMLPDIPTWLAASLPKRAIVLPDGGAVTYGPLGSGAGPIEPAKWRYDAAGNPEVYYRYDSAGQEVARTTPGQPWQELFLPGYTQTVLLESSKQGLIPVMLNGYTFLSSMATGEPVTAYDYTGTTVAPEVAASPRPQGIVVEIEGEHLAKVAAVQGL
jgi:hypothetical protein